MAINRLSRRNAAFRRQHPALEQRIQKLRSPPLWRAVAERSADTALGGAERRGIPPLKFQISTLPILHFSFRVLRPRSFEPVNQAQCLETSMLI